MLSTKDLGKEANSTPKTLEPGNRSAKINKITVEDFPFRANAKHIILHLEGPDLGSEFQGFYIDKDNPDAGRHAGQVAKVKASDFAFSDSTTKTGIVIERDREMLRFIKNICTALGKEAVDWFESIDGVYGTVEDLIDAFNQTGLFKDVFFDFCIAGKKYMNKAGYETFDMYLPKFTKTTVPFELTDSSPSKLISFNPSVHITELKPKAVASFQAEGGAPPVSAKGDFDL